MIHDRYAPQSRRAVFALGVLLGVAHMLPTSAAADSAAANGIWGAQDAVLTIGATASRIEWGHAEATINGPIKMAADGHFKVVGRYRALAPGPDRIKGVPATSTAHIEGHIIGDSMQMTMHVSGERAVRRYVFKKGQQTKLHRML
jgi:hypothetical protein